MTCKNRKTRPEKKRVILHVPVHVMFSPNVQLKVPTVNIKKLMINGQGDLVNRLLEHKIGHWTASLG